MFRLSAGSGDSGLGSCKAFRRVFRAYSKVSGCLLCYRLFYGPLGLGALEAFLWVLGLRFSLGFAKIDLCDLVQSMI